MAGSLAPLLVELLVCPEDHQPLTYVPSADVLYNPRLRRVYSVIDGIPDLLIDDAHSSNDAEHQQYLSAADAVLTGTAGSSK